MTDTIAKEHAVAGEAILCHPNEKRLMVFSGRSNPELSGRIAELLGVRLGRVALKTFANGENYARYEESIRGCDAFLVQSPCGPNLNADLMELLLMVQAAKLASARRVTAVMPYYPYARQDKKSTAREPISARLVANLLEAAGADRVLSMDLHQGQIQGFFQIPVDHMTAVPMLADHFAFRDWHGTPLVIVSADAGGLKLARRFQNHLPDADLAVLTKQRPAHNRAEVMHFIGDVRDKVAIIIDDMIDTAGTTVSAVETLCEHGAKEVYVAATHGIFSPPARERFRQSPVKEVVVTDTIRVQLEPEDSKIKVLTVAGVLAKVIGAVFDDESVSDIFAGEHQLF